MTVVYIYALVDPTTDEVRYVGKSNYPQKRYTSHLMAKEPSNPYKNNWINKLKGFGLKPTLIILEETTLDLWPEREKHWITFYRDMGCNLTNLSNGGLGGGLLAESTKLLIGQKTKEYWAANPDRKEKMRRAQSRVILCSDGREFDSIKSGAETLGIQQHTLRKYCETGEEWNGMTFAYLRKRIKKDSNNSRIRCIETGEVYNSILEASIKLSTNRRAIKESLKFNKHIKGLHYEYMDKTKVLIDSPKAIFECVETGEKKTLDDLVLLSSTSGRNINRSVKRGYLIAGFHYRKLVDK